jgi:hypothetical protein
MNPMWRPVEKTIRVITAQVSRRCAALWGIPSPELHYVMRESVKAADTSHPVIWICCPALVAGVTGGTTELDNILGRLLYEARALPKETLFCLDDFDLLFSGSRVSASILANAVSDRSLRFVSPSSQPVLCLYERQNPNARHCSLNCETFSIVQASR